MPQSGEILKEFYAQVAQKNLVGARQLLDDDLIFYGLFETYSSASSYITALTGLLSVTSKIDIRTIISEGDQAAIFFDLETVAPVAGKTLVAEWHQVKDGKIHRVSSAFDGRLFAKMFS